MCDFTLILAAIAAAQIALVAAIVLTGVAIAANSSFFGAPGAPIPFGLAVASAAIAAGSLAMASSALAAPACATAGACSAEIAAARTAIDFMTGTLAATTILGILAFALSAVPVAGAIAMGGYAAGLIIASLATGPATNTVAVLQRCVDAAASSTVATVLVVTGFVVSLLALGFILVVIGIGRNGGGDPEPDPFGPKD